MWNGRKEMKVGTLVKLKTALLGNPAGTIGVCYEEYDLGEGSAGSVIFPNGNYDGFSPQEQEKFLEVIGGHLGCSMYEFTNVMKLSTDFQDGVFAGVLGDPNEKK